MQHIIIRTEKIRSLKEQLKERKVLFLSSFFYSGKTILLKQLAQNLDGKVLTFDAAVDNWDTFAAAAYEMTQGTLLLDNLHRLQDSRTGEKIAAMMAGLPDGKYAVMAGRSQGLEALHTMYIRGDIAILDRNFVLFEMEEIEQLLLDYGIELGPLDLAYLKERMMGWPFGIHIAAQQILKNPGKPLRSLNKLIREEVRQILIQDVVSEFPEQERILLYNLSPFSSFTGDMARIITGRNDAPAVMAGIVRKSHMLFFSAPDEYYFMPLVRDMLFQEMQNYFSRDYINGQYKRAALFYELEGNIVQAIACYRIIQDKEKIRELLIRDTVNRPASGNYALLQDAYRMLDEKTILESPELMKGICMIESLHGRHEESERWYRELTDFIRRTPSRDARRKSAEEAVAYLDISLSHRGTKGMLKQLVSIAGNGRFIQSESWKSGFNVAGNSVSLMNGGKDFSRWAPHGEWIYRIAARPVEIALGRGGRGVADLAIGECELETNLTEDYSSALDKVIRGMARLTDDLELRCAAIGIQSRILTAQGNVQEAILQMNNLIESLPENAPVKLVQNMKAHLLTLRLVEGDLQDAVSWMETDAPDETKEFLILDRYTLMLKLRLYIVTGQWQKTQLLMARLRHYSENYDRPYIRIKLHLLQAVIDHRCGEEQWKEEIAAAVHKAARYRLTRVIADEGIAVLDMLNEILQKKKFAADSWAKEVLNLTRIQAARYPNYLRPNAVRPVFSDREYQVYSLLIAGYRNARIATVLNITERTVKHYTAEIYRKLGVENRSEALRRAAELGDIH